MAPSAAERAEEPPMYARAWLNLKHNTVALAVFLRRVFVFLTIAIGVRPPARGRRLAGPSQNALTRPTDLPPPRAARRQPAGTTCVPFRAAIASEPRPGAGTLRRRLRGRRQANRRWRHRPSETLHRPAWPPGQPHTPKALPLCSGCLPFAGTPPPAPAHPSQPPAQPPPASLSWCDGPLLVGYAAKGLVFPGNLVRAINQMQRVPKKEMRGFLWKLFEHGLELGLVSVNGKGQLSVNGKVMVSVNGKGMEGDGECECEGTGECECEGVVSVNGKGLVSVNGKGLEGDGECEWEGTGECECEEVVSVNGKGMVSVNGKRV
eukprot:scaffold15252_cov93-Isochrysis_galbana.AAC.4